MKMNLELQTKEMGQVFFHRTEVDSTNTELRKLAETGAVHGTVLAADRQTKGRGRMGRSWDSPEGDNIYLSLLLRPEFEPAKASMLTLIAALSAVSAIEEETGISCQIKWPNDLVLDGRKVCGILTEMKAGTDGIQYVIAGIGINVNREVFPEEIAHMAGSIQADDFREGDEPRTGRQKEAIIEKLLFHFEEKYNLFLRCENLAPFLEEYNGRLAGLGKQVQILSREGNRIGVSRGIDENGGLLISNEAGITEKIISGEVSVRGLYGYVD